MARIGNISAAMALIVGFAQVALAAPEHLTVIERECSKQEAMAAQNCRCLRERAARLNDGQQAFVAAIVLRNKQAQATIGQKLSVQEPTKAGAFLTTASA